MTRKSTPESSPLRASRDEFLSLIASHAKQGRSSRRAALAQRNRRRSLAKSKSLGGGGGGGGGEKVPTSASAAAAAAAAAAASDAAVTAPSPGSIVLCEDSQAAVPPTTQQVPATRVAASGKGRPEPTIWAWLGYSQEEAPHATQPAAGVMEEACTLLEQLQPMAQGIADTVKAFHARVGELSGGTDTLSIRVDPPQRRLSGLLSVEEEEEAGDTAPSPPSPPPLLPLQGSNGSSTEDQPLRFPSSLPSISLEQFLQQPKTIAAAAAPPTASPGRIHNFFETARRAEPQPPMRPPLPGSVAAPRHHAPSSAAAASLSSQPLRQHLAFDYLRGCVVGFVGFSRQCPLLFGLQRLVVAAGGWCGRRGPEYSRKSGFRKEHWSWGHLERECTHIVINFARQKEEGEGSGNSHVKKTATGGGPHGIDVALLRKQFPLAAPVTPAWLLACYAEQRRVHPAGFEWHREQHALPRTVYVDKAAEVQEALEAWGLLAGSMKRQRIAPKPMQP